MAVLHDIRRRARLMLGPLIGACLAFYFGYHAINGTRGILAVRQLDREIAAARETLRIETEKRTALERRVTLLRPDSLGPDMLEERARILLNFGGPDDVVILNADPTDGRRRPVRVTSP